MVKKNVINVNSVKIVNKSKHRMLLLTRISKCCISKYVNKNHRNNNKHYHCTSKKKNRFVFKSQDSNCVQHNQNLFCQYL